MGGRIALLAALVTVVWAAPAGAQMPGGAPQAPAGALHRYFSSSTGTHWVTPTPVTGDFSYELSLGFLYTSPGPGRAPIYGCLHGSTDYFLSRASNCEGQAVLGTYGWAAQERPAEAAVPLYRCWWASSGSHFASNDAGCEGQTSEGRLGYLRARSNALSRYWGGNHWVTTRIPAKGYSLEAVLGFLLDEGGANRRALYECAAGGDHFLSLDQGCEGRSEQGAAGYVYVSPPPGEDVQPVYRCRTSSDHFASLGSGCEGQVSEGLLGYVRRTQDALQRAYSPAHNTHWVSSAAIPPGWFSEFVLGFVLKRAGSGRVALYSCRAGSADQFLSRDPSCEGQAKLGQEGWLYTAAPPGVPAAPLYRCLRPGLGHFASTAANCEGQRPEGLLGYVRSDGPEPAPPPLGLGCAPSGAKVSLSLRGRKVRRVRFGGSATVRGRALNADGTPAAGTLVSLLIGARKPIVLGQIVAAPDGRFQLKVTPGKNRIIHAGFRTEPENPNLACSRNVRLNVRAGLTLRARPKRVRFGGRVRFRGRLIGHPIPRVGKLIDLQAFDGGRWRTFRTTRANAKGRYHARYHFIRTTRPRTFRFRARARREARYPYALGVSKVVKVRVR
jgi:hypothetical protein